MSLCPLPRRRISWRCLNWVIKSVLDSYDNDEDGVPVFVIECDNSNPTHIASLQSRLDKLESEGIGYEREGNGNGFYGRNYIFYKYSDVDDSVEESKKWGETGLHENSISNQVRKVLIDIGVSWGTISEEDEVVYVHGDKPYSPQDLKRVYSKLDVADGSGFSDETHTMWFSF